MGLLSAMVKGKEVNSLINQIEALRDDKRKLKEELEDLKLKKRLEQEEITHMTRINEERMKQEVESEKIALKKQATEDMATFKEEQRLLLIESLKQFHTKMEERFNSELGNLKEVYSALMARLPNVNLTLTKKM